MKMKWLSMVALVAVIFAASAVQADDTAGPLVRFKTGEVSFTLLQADGVTPMNAAAIKMLAADNGRVQVEAVSDSQGKAAVTLAEGRYLLNIDGRTLSVLEAAGDATLTSCRVVVPAVPLVVAGAADDQQSSSTNRAGGFWLTSGGLTPVLIGGAVVLVAGGGGYAIYDNNKDEDNAGDDVVPPGTTPPTTPPTERHRPKASK